MAGKGRERDAAKEAFWRQQVRLWEQSLLTIPAFCKQHNLTLRAFYRWRQLLAARDRPAPPAQPEPAELARFVLPILDELKCTGCGDCVAVCPAACLEMGGPLPWLPRPADCVSCALCAAVCPEDAITMGDAQAAR
jgi:NAD-dependent dihydropyrimidine dehydrogenase PreA subunit